MERYITYVSGRSLEDEKKTFEIAFRMVMQLNKENNFNCYLYPDAKNSILPIEALEELLGENLFKDLIKNEFFYYKNLKINLIIEKSIHKLSGEKNIIIAIWNKQKFLNIIDDYSDKVKYEIVIPNSEEYVQDWKYTWKYCLIKNDKLECECIDNLDNIDEKIIQTVDSIIELLRYTEYLKHSSDKVAIKKILKELKKSGIPFNRNQIKAITLRKGRNHEDAEEIAKIADKVLK